MDSLSELHEDFFDHARKACACLKFIGRDHLAGCRDIKIECPGTQARLLGSRLAEAPTTRLHRQQIPRGLQSRLRLFTQIRWAPILVSRLRPNRGGSWPCAFRVNDLSRLDACIREICFHPERHRNRIVGHADRRIAERDKEDRNPAVQRRELLRSPQPRVLIGRRSTG